MTICCLHRHHPIYVTTVHHQEGDIDSGDGDALLLQSIPSTSAIFTMITITTILPVPPWPLLPSSAWLDQLYCPAINFYHFCHVPPHTSFHLITHAHMELLQNMASFRNLWEQVVNSLTLQRSYSPSRAEQQCVPSPNFRDHDPRITLFAPSSTPPLPSSSKRLMDFYGNRNSSQRSFIRRPVANILCSEKNFDL